MPVLYAGNKIFEEYNAIHNREENEMKREIKFLQEFKSDVAHYLGDGSCSITVDLEDCCHNFGLTNPMCFTLVVCIKPDDTNPVCYKVEMLGKVAPSLTTALVGTLRVRENFDEPLQIAYNNGIDNFPQYKKILGYITKQFPRTGEVPLTFS